MSERDAMRTILALHLGETFCASYFDPSGFNMGVIYPWTHTADRVFRKRAAAVLKEHNITLGKPLAEPGPEAWKPIGDVEYQTLSLRDKVRHHRILAHEALLKAGAQWKGGKPIDKDNMPVEWRKWTSVAVNHVAEAQRLEGKFRKDQAA